MNNRQIVLQGVKVHNLKNVNLSLPTEKFIVLTGVSGSGKSSLAFDTIFVEGQRRYIESLPHSMRHNIQEYTKPDAEKITGISPTIAIEQKNIAKSPRSTVGTMTTIYDFLRVLFSRIGIPHCPISHEKILPQNRDTIMNLIPKERSIILLAPFLQNKKGTFKKEFEELVKKGFLRVRIDGKIERLSEISPLNPKTSHNIDIVIDRLETCAENKSRLQEALYLALETGKGFLKIIDVTTKEETFFSEYAYSKKADKFYPPLEPAHFSFNHPLGMCPECQGLGETYAFDLTKIIDPDKSIAQGCCSIASDYHTVYYSNVYDNLAKLYKFSLHTPWKNLSLQAQNVFLYGTEEKWVPIVFSHPKKKTQYASYMQWKGVLPNAYQRLKQAKSELYRKKMHALMHITTCPLCHGHRLQAYPLATILGGKKIDEIVHMPIYEAYQFFLQLPLTSTEKIIGQDLLDEITKRLSFLIDVGLSYLTLDRSSATLSGGEAQRVKLSAQLGSNLSGTTYVLDEPSIGLHPHDHHLIISALQSLKEKGNTIIVVEHDRETIMAADYIVDMGPYAGKNGGEIIAKGTPDEIMRHKQSLTGQYLTGVQSISPPKSLRKTNLGTLSLHGASLHNLKNVTLHIPLHCLVCVTGVSGSGKSSLIGDTLYPAIYNHIHHSTYRAGPYKKIDGLDPIKRVLFVDQSPIGKTPRSNPATYIKVLDDIRDLYASLPLSRMRGYTSSHFSFNVAEGSCPYCKGLGEVRIDMDFLEDVYTPCIQCKGTRYDPEVLEVTYKDKSILDILQMEIALAKELFSPIPKIYEKLLLLCEVGLDYMQLGQPSTTLSGGEAQRIKLAKELSKPNIENTLYILDEPTTGLHFHDMKKLIAVLQKLIDRGSSAIIIEHNMDFVKVADWIIEMGSGGGEKGGSIIAQGRVSHIAKLNTATGQALRSSFTKTPVPKIFSKEKRSFISIENAESNNLKNISLTIPKGKISVFTGPSGSGKSSLAFDTIFAEGQKRYLEAMPPYVRQFLKQLPPPKVKRIDGLSPCIAIEQKGHNLNPRSTIGTLTEIYDLLRLLFAHLGIPYCPKTHEEIKTISKEYVVKKILELPSNEKICILAPLNLQDPNHFPQIQKKLQQEGFLRIRLNNSYYLLEDKIPVDPHKKNSLFLVIDRLVISDQISHRLLEAIALAAKIGHETITIATEQKDLFFNLSFAVESTGQSYPPITPQTFSFNAEVGMCPECQGLGNIYCVNFANEPYFLELSPMEICHHIFKRKLSHYTITLLEEYFRQVSIDLYRPLQELEEEKKSLFLKGGPLYKVKNFSFRWRGIFPVLEKAAKHSKGYYRHFLAPSMKEITCSGCHGNRLNPLAQNVKIHDISITDLCNMEIDSAVQFIQTIHLEQSHFLYETLQQIRSQLYFIQEIGLGYLSLNRSVPTLSGGELQRIRLAKHLGTGLTSCIYLLDEPTIGLHPYNNHLMMNALKKLQQLDNTLILVEHDPLIIKQADYLVDFGPQAGHQGGQIIAKGSYQDIIQNPHSITGNYLNKKAIIPSKKPFLRKGLSIEKASLHNLKNISVDIPSGGMICITGVSGSGKSTLVYDIIKPAIKTALQTREKNIIFPFASIKNADMFDSLISLDQNPIGQTVRSDISTYSDIHPLLRQFFASLPSARAKGLQPRFFSANHKKGMCKKCLGLGYQKIDLQYLPSVKVVCDSCKGYKLNAQSLDIRYKAKHLGEILQLTIDQATEFFEAHPKIVKKLRILHSVGLGYLSLGQEINTLSGGEAQRLRLAKELSKKAQGHTLYLFDEPSIGLHFSDIEKLLPIFHQIAQKHTLLIIEHNLDIIAHADHIIDLGPDAGKKGGQVIFNGSVQEMLKSANTPTAQFLKNHLYS
ncbi:MAG: excinuclease ABC subunit UvrA [Parachlamydiales bacterium]|nr:excinuclease ABC subunit UvrA [Parachlamydiales bacterium]